MSPQAAQVAQVPEPDRFRLYTFEEVLNLPSAEWLIEGVLPRQAIGVLYGPSGDGKSFVALDMSLSVATGQDWSGRPVRAGSVIYVVAEGGAGISKRAAAWAHHRGLDDIPGAFFVLHSVQVADPGAVRQLGEQIERITANAALIVFDTFAACAAGIDENSAQDVGRIMSQLRYLQQGTGATVLTVHHTGKSRSKKQSPDTERGSSAMRAAADVMLLQQMARDGVITITNNKQKDAEQSEPLFLRLDTVEVGRNENNQPITSCVVVASDAPEAGLAMFPNAQELKALCTLVNELGGGPVTATKWRERMGEGQQDLLPRRTFDNWREGLTQGGFVESLDGSPPRYKATDAGQQLVAAANGTPATANGA